MTEDFATVLRRLMAQRGLTVRELARRVPCTHSYLSMLSSGRRRHPSPEVADRLDRLLGAGGELAEAAGRPGHAPLSRRDYETWADDLERAMVYASRQNFPAALTLSGRWLNRFRIGQLDPKGLYLHARSLVVLGDVRRDQGALLGPLSAHRSYRLALRMFSDLGTNRRVAQVMLSLVVIDEMTGNLRDAARCYQALAADERLSDRDRARSRLWIGTALSKAGENEHAARVMTEAAARFEQLDEAEDWSVAQQKLALAYRGAGDVDRALRFIEIARSGGADDSPMQRVRLGAAHAHILLSDRATSQQGLALLEKTAQLARGSGLGHQLRSVDRIRRDFERSGGARS